MEEFSQSRYRLESRYQHVLVDELQDTSRAQWRLVELLVRAWGEGDGVAHEGPTPPSIFVVGDRKQSIYGFRDAEVGVLDAAARLIGRLRPGPRAAPRHRQELPRGAGAAALRQRRVRRDRQARRPRRRVPLRRPRSLPGADGDWPGPPGGARGGAADTGRLRPRRGRRDRAAAGTQARPCAIATPACRARSAPGDIAILFRTRDSHREFERELDARRRAVLRLQGPRVLRRRRSEGRPGARRSTSPSPTPTCAPPRSCARASCGCPIEALKQLAPRLAGALRRRRAAAGAGALGDEDRARARAARGRRSRAGSRCADRLPPAELVDRVLHESAYAVEMRGRGPRAGAREPEEAARPDPPHAEPRLRHAGRVADRVVAADGGRRIERDHRRGRRREPDDGARRQGPRVPGRVRGQPVARHRRTRRRGGGRDARRRRRRPSTIWCRSTGWSTSAGEEIEAREREETKRLVYVALTRARDRLYLATTLAQPRARSRRRRPRSGAVLPASLGPRSRWPPCRRRAPTARVDWTAASGARHELRVVTAAAVPVVAPSRRRRRRRRRLRAARRWPRTAPRNVTDVARAGGAGADASPEARDRAAARGPSARSCIARSPPARSTADRDRRGAARRDAGRATRPTAHARRGARGRRRAWPARADVARAHHGSGCAA